MFADLAIIRTALAALVDTEVVKEVKILASLDREVIQSTPFLAVLPIATDCAGPGGIGNGRILTESLGVLVTIRSLNGDAEAAASLQFIRSSVYAIMEGQRLLAGWSPLRYQGGQMLAIDNAAYSWLERYSCEGPAKVAA